MAANCFWTDLAWTDFQARDMGRVIAVLPLAAVEQHGPHLPTGVDAAIMDGYLARVLERAPDDLPVLFLPVQRVGVSVEHEAYPGTLSLSFETAARAWIEIGASVRRAGCRKLVLLNAHVVDVAVMEAVARELRARHGMFVVSASWHRFGYPDGLFTEAETAYGIHAGDIETSLMMGVAPQSVREEEIADFPSAGAQMERNFAWLGPRGPWASAGWRRTCPKAARWATRAQRPRTRAPPPPITGRRRSLNCSATWRRSIWRASRKDRSGRGEARYRSAPSGGRHAGEGQHPRQAAGRDLVVLVVARALQKPPRPPRG